MRDWPITLVSAFGRGETLALALHENGYQVQILDFTAAFTAETHRGSGPFPLINKTYLPAQRDLLKLAKPLPHGLNLWLDDGPMDLSGTMSAVHAGGHPELKAWQQGAGGREFKTAWLRHWLQQWTSPYHLESWDEDSAVPFPALEPIGLLPVANEERSVGITYLMAKGLTVRACSKIWDARTENSRLQEIVVDCGTKVAVQAKQWIWCLSSAETKMFGEDVASILFWRGVIQPEWAWISFEGSMTEGSWSAGLPDYTVVIGDEFLPWVNSNAFVLRRTEGERFRVWIKVPHRRASDIDARRGWGLGVENILRARLPQANWRIDSGAWSICPHSEVFAKESRGPHAGQWKNWDWISPETLPRLDLSARLEAEAASFARISAWRDEQLKKQGVPRDHALHAP